MKLLKDRNIFLYILYTFLFGLYPIIPIMSLFFLAKQLSFGDIGILYAVFSISGFIFEIPTGYLGDKFGRKNSVMVGLAILGITSFVWTTLSGTIMFAIFAAIWMLGLAFISGSFDGYIYDYLKSKKQESSYDKLISFGGTTSYFAGAIGSIIGAYIFSININYPYFLLGILFFLCIFVVMMMRPDTKILDAEFKDELKVFSGMKYIVSNKSVLWITLYIALLFGFFSYFRSSIDKPFILSLELFDVKWLGVFVAASMFIQSIFMSQFAKIKEKIGENGLIISFFITSSIPLIIMSYSYGVLALLAITIFYTNESFQGALINSFCQKHIPSQIRATTLSSINVYINIFGAILALISGYIFDVYSIRTGLQIAFIYTVLVFFGSYLLPLAFTKLRPASRQGGSL
jgi:MFS family permease